jgi:hypothetical protein
LTRGDSNASVKVRLLVEQPSHGLSPTLLETLAQASVDARADTVETFVETGASLTVEPLHG